MTHELKPITTLKEYWDAISKIVESQGDLRFIYRGQKNKDWDIQSSALRRLQKTQITHPELLPSIFMGYIHQIIDEVQLRYSNTYKDLTALECMAHMQHNRTATGLIDFTYNPLNALWFACDTDKSTDGKIFVIDTQDQNHQIKEIKTIEDLKKELIYFSEKDKTWYLWQPSIGNPNIDTQRITIQQSVFLFGKPEVPKDMIKGEILISGEHKGKLLKELETMGILEKTLFSDLAGFFERSAVNSTYNNELAEHFYTEQIRKSKEANDEEALTFNHFQRGNFRSALENYKGAIEDYNEAIEKNSNYAEAYNNRGIANAEFKEYKEAIKDFDKAIEKNSNYAEAYNNRGIANAEFKEYKEAIKDYNEAIKINLKYAEAYNNRGIANAELKEYKEAIKDYNEAIKINPKFAKAYYNRGIANAKLKEYKEAIKDFDKAIKINPKYAIAYNNRGNANAELKEYKEAIKDYDKAIEINSKFAIAYNNRGVALSKWEDAKADLITAKNKGAIKDFDKAIEINSKYAEAYNNRGIANAKLKEYKKAIKDYNEAIEINSKYAIAYYNRGVTYLYLSKWEDAKADLTTAKDKGADIVALFQDEFKSVSDFEKKFNVTLPDEIKAQCLSNGN